MKHKLVHICESHLKQKLYLKMWLQMYNFSPSAVFLKNSFCKVLLQIQILGLINIILRHEEVVS